MKLLAVRGVWASLIVVQLSWACSGAFSVEGYEVPGEVAGSANLGAGAAIAAAGGGSNSSAGSFAAVGGSAGETAQGGGATTPSGEAGSGEAGGGEPPDDRVYCDAVTEVFQYKCAPSCHGNERVAIGDFAVALERAAPLVDKPSIRDPGCGLVIDSANPSGSLILTKVTGGYQRDGIDCGGAMPVGSIGDMPPEEVTCIADWLQQFKR